MNSFGEIHDLQRICMPTIRLITNVGPVHLEGLGSIEGVAKAKGELFAGARVGDLLLVNADDNHIIGQVPEKEGVKLKYFGTDKSCDMQLTDVQGTAYDTTFTIRYATYLLL